MMNLIKRNKAISILFVVLIIIGAFYLIRWFLASRTEYIESYLRDEEYVMNPKTYNINEYSITNISDEKMSSIYLLDYIHLIYSDIDNAYNLIDESYRNEKFGSVDNFKKYIDSVNISNIMSKYYILNKGDYDIYGVYDSNNNLFIFKVNGVMQYSVYLDDYTVEIW